MEHVESGREQTYKSHLLLIEFLMIINQHIADRRLETMKRPAEIYSTFLLLQPLQQLSNDKEPFKKKTKSFILTHS